MTTVFQTQSVSGGLHHKNIAIIGSGLSGLSTAMTLIEAAESNNNIKLNIKILEARDRVGGRTCTEKINVVPISKGYHHQPTIDVGGQWIGANQVRVLKLIDKFDLKLKEQVIFC